MKTTKNKAQSRRQRVKGNSHLKTTHAPYELDDVLFNEMFKQVKMLIQLKGGCDKYELRQQFQNLSFETIHHFLLVAMKRGIIKEYPVGTFMLQ
jgi:hypothetical protein